MSTTLTSISSLINSLDSQAAAWYSGISGSPVVVPATSAQQAAANALALQQQAQANLLVTNPTLAGLLANPTVVIFALILLAVGLYFAFR